MSDSQTTAVEEKKVLSDAEQRELSASAGFRDFTLDELEEIRSRSSNQVPKGNPAPLLYVVGED